MLVNYLNITSTIFYYLESNILILFSSLGIIKIHSKTILCKIINKDTMYCLNNFTNQSVKYINSFFFIISFGYTNRFKSIGVGYKYLTSNNILLFKLRYSHLIYKCLPLNILNHKIIKTKKRRYFSFFSLNKDSVNNIINRIIFFRVPNIYTKKGFFKQNKTMLFKKMIKRTI